MSGGRQTQTTQSQTGPWGPAQGALQNIIGQAQTLGQDQSLFTPNYSTATLAGVQGLETAGSQPGAAAGYLPGVVNGVGAGFGTGLDTLKTTAAGGNLGGNPYLDAVLARSGAETANLVNQQFSGAGRYGSAAHTGTLADRIGQQQTQARMQDYQTERGNQIQAAGTLYGGGIQGAGLANQLDQANLYDEQLLLQAGQMRDQMDAATRGAPLTALDWTRAQIAPIGAMGQEGNQTTTTRTPANVGGMIMGAGMTALGAMTGNPLMMMNGVGSALGASGSMGNTGGLGGLGGFSPMQMGSLNGYM